MRGIRAEGKHGAHAGERDRLQLFALDVRLELDLSPAARTDDLAQTVDYAAVHQKIVRIVEQRSYNLLERLAVDIADSLFADARIVRAEVCIAKPGVLDSATPVIIVHRENPHFRGA